MIEQEREQVVRQLVRSKLRVSEGREMSCEEEEVHSATHIYISSRLSLLTDG